MLSIKITGSDELQRRLAGVPDRVRASLLAKVWILAIELENYVKRDKLSGQVLNAVTGRLRRSIHSDVKVVGDTVVGRVFSSGDVPYADIQEFGGRTSPHDIFPVKAQALAFMQNGKMAFYKHVRHPGSKIPERSYLRSALADKRDHIVEEMTKAVEEGLS
jgi:phage gpG-like protein